LFPLAPINACVIISKKLHNRWEVTPRSTQ
jgi:hypothetical protein